MFENDFDSVPNHFCYLQWLKSSAIKSGRRLSFDSFLHIKIPRLVFGLKG